MNVIQKDPGIIVGPISSFMGVILDFLFNFSYSITEKNSLGLSIIFLTIIVRFLMLPLMMKSQKSMVGIQKLQPEMEKIRNKHGNSKDPEIQRKINVEIQELYSKNKVNPISGCLPLFVTFPIFIALSYVMNQTYIFVDKLGVILRDMSEVIIEKVPDFIEVIVPIATPMVPRGMQIDISIPEDLMRVLNKFTPANFQAVLDSAPPEVAQQLAEIILLKDDIQYFMGVNLTEFAGLAFPGILIPILAAATSYLTSWYSTRTMNATDQSAKLQKRMLLIVMPIMIGVMTINLPSGVGLYWITSGVFQIIQQPILNKFYIEKLKKEA